MLDVISFSSNHFIQELNFMLFCVWCCWFDFRALPQVLPGRVSPSTFPAFGSSPSVLATLLCRAVMHMAPYGNAAS